jgi:peroxiredoxin
MEVGNKAKRFSLSDQDGKEFNLAKLHGKRILLSFHPLAWTSVCSEQMKSLEKNKSSFDSMNTIAVGVSCDTVPSKKAWAEHLKISATRLLSDFWPHGKTAKAYGLFLKNDGISGRSNIVVDEKGMIRLCKNYPLGKLPGIEEIKDFLGKMPKIK